MQTNKSCLAKPTDRQSLIMPTTCYGPLGTSRGDIWGPLWAPRSFDQHLMVALVPSEKMKFLAVILATAFIAGSQARFLLLGDEPKSKWEESVDNFWQYVSKIGTGADDIVGQIKSSQLSRELDGLITDTMAELNLYTDDLKNKIAPYTQSMASQFGDDIVGMKDKLHLDMTDVKNKMVQYSEELRLMVDQNVEEVKSKMNIYMRKLKKKLSKDSEDLRRKFTTYAEDLRTRTSQNMEAMRDRFEPYTSDIKEKTQQKLDSLQQIFTDQAKSIRDRFNGKATEFKSDFEQKAKEVQGLMQDKAEELRNWFEPYINNLRQQFDTMLENLKPKSN
ncbi:APOEB protein, partial [Polypterus senegalus]